jgi:hypothetical protein
MTDRPADDPVDTKDTLDTHPPSQVPDEEEMKTKRAYRENTGPRGRKETSRGSRKEKDVDEASKESFPASDPPSY